MPLLLQKSCHHRYWDRYTAIVDLEYRSSSSAHPSWSHSPCPCTLANRIMLPFGKRVFAVLGLCRKSIVTCPCGCLPSLGFWSLCGLKRTFLLLPPTRLEGEDPPFGLGGRGQKALHNPLHRHQHLQRNRLKRARSTANPIAESGSSSSPSLPFPTLANKEIVTKGPVAIRDTVPGAPFPKETFCWTTWWREVLRNTPRTWSIKLL